MTVPPTRRVCAGLAAGAGLALAATAIHAAPAAKGSAADKGDPAIYQTYGVHNPPDVSPCQNPDCVYRRRPDEPTDPQYPPYWSAKWTMYRVFNNYAAYPPPYDRSPPVELRKGVDYEVSYGATYYDSTWRSPAGHGAMMEHYEKRCLPIFPISNHYSCSFISVGKTAYFLTYPEDRPAGMPPVCLFSPKNHAPRTDFIKHLPYSHGDSARLSDTVQGYSFWIDGNPDSPTAGKVMQIGAAPDSTAKQWIMFGYAFDRTPRPDTADPTEPPYRHPHSFYFSGYPMSPPNAPFVSQNYTGFAIVRPDPAKTWDLVKRLNPAKLPKCQLFDPPTAGLAADVEGRRHPTWGDLRRNR